MPDDVGRWLEELDLGGYAQAFAENKIDFRVLPELNSEDLREMNFPLGPRKLPSKDLRCSAERGGEFWEYQKGISLGCSLSRSGADRPSRPRRNRPLTAPGSPRRSP